MLYFIVVLCAILFYWLHGVYDIYEKNKFYNEIACKSMKINGEFVVITKRRARKMEDCMGILHLKEYPEWDSESME